MSVEKNTARLAARAAARGETFVTDESVLASMADRMARAHGLERARIPVAALAPRPWMARLVTVEGRTTFAPAAELALRGYALHAALWRRTVVIGREQYPVSLDAYLDGDGAEQLVCAILFGDTCEDDVVALARIVIPRITSESRKAERAASKVVTAPSDESRGKALDSLAMRAALVNAHPLIRPVILLAVEMVEAEALVKRRETAHRKAVSTGTGEAEAHARLIVARGAAAAAESALRSALRVNAPVIRADILDAPEGAEIVA